MLSLDSYIIRIYLHIDSAIYASNVCQNDALCHFVWNLSLQYLTVILQYVRKIIMCSLKLCCVLTYVYIAQSTPCFEVPYEPSIFRYNFLKLLSMITKQNDFFHFVIIRHFETFHGIMRHVIK